MMNRPPVTFKDRRTKKNIPISLKGFFFSFIPPAAQICKDKAQKKEDLIYNKKKKTRNRKKIRKVN